MYTLINNNFDMIKGMDNLFDYDEYVALCNEKEIPIRPLGNYLHGVGVLQYSLNKYGGDWQEAYLKGFNDVNNQDSADTQTCGDKLPSLPQQAKNLGQAVISHAINGFKQADDYENRIAICEGCERFKNDKCLECGCFMKVKAKWAEQSCPINKW